MWSSDRRSLILGGAAIAALSGCGFAPVYGRGTAASATRGRISVSRISGLLGFTLRTRLTARLGPADAASHQLKVTVDISRRGLAVSRENEITRYNLTGTAKYTLTPIGETGKTARGSVRAFAAYSATASPFATRSAEQDARERLALALADQIASRLAVTAEEWAA